MYRIYPNRLYYWQFVGGFNDFRFINMYEQFSNCVKYCSAIDCFSDFGGWEAICTKCVYIWMVYKCTFNYASCPTFRKII